MTDERIGIKNLWNDTDRERPEVRGEKLVPAPLRPPQIPHGLTCNSTQVCDVRSATNRLSRGTVGRPYHFVYGVFRNTTTLIYFMRHYPSVRLGVNYE